MYIDEYGWGILTVECREKNWGLRVHKIGIIYFILVYVALK